MQTAIIKTESNYNLSGRICGLYPLERNIVILSKIGVKKIYLDLSETEKAFYEKKIKKHLTQIGDTAVEFGDSKKIAKSEKSIIIPSNLFTQVHHFSDIKKYFAGKANLAPVYDSKQFIIRTGDDYDRAQKLVADYIIKNTGGFIAQKFNKRVSIPISMQVAKTRIHPNYLTVINMFVGLLSGVFVLMNTYAFIALGGLFFQMASVLDGVDGEVAKFTFKVSKIGGWLDTLSDNLTLLLFLGASSYLFYLNSGGYSSIVIIALCFIGLATTIGAMVQYLKRHSESGSLVNYDKEFLQKLPQNDFMIKTAISLKYFTKKEFFSVLFCLIAFTGRIDMIIPFLTFILIASSALLWSINGKYLKNFKHVK